MVEVEVEVECEHCGHKFWTTVTIDDSEIEDWTCDDEPRHNEGYI